MPARRVSHDNRSSILSALSPSHAAVRAEEGLQRYRAEHGIAAPWETRERTVVGIAGLKDDEVVIRRAARIAASTPGSDLLAVHVNADDLAVGAVQVLETQRRSWPRSAAASMRCRVQTSLLRFARTENATQMVLGASKRSRLLTLIAGRSVPTRVAAGRIR